jgi:YhcH/YjgK/YiaL family protein
MICAPYKELIIPDKQRSSNWEKAIVWLWGDSWKDLPPGKTELDEKRLYAIRSSYMSKKKSECFYESHRLNVDVQMVIKGSEAVLVCQRDVLKVVEPYSQGKDSDLLEGEPDNVHRIILGFPMVLVLFPWDVHMTSLAPDDMPGEVEKIVLKVAI